MNRKDRPKIALMASLDGEERVCVSQYYLNAIWKSGGVGVLLPYNTSKEYISQACEYFDGFLFCGGEDISPKYYGEEPHETVKSICTPRDEFEMAMFKEVFATGKAILGICRGEQLINVALGGNLHQHIDNHVQSTPKSSTEHLVHVAEGSFLHSIIKEKDIHTNTFHHQNVKELGKGLVCDAVSYDGYIEAYHHENHKFCLGVQWHPECYYDSSTSSSLIFDAFINSCK